MVEARKTAPTHPHPRAPDTPPGQLGEWSARRRRGPRLGHDRRRWPGHGDGRRGSRRPHPRSRSAAVVAAWFEHRSIQREAGAEHGRDRHRHGGAHRPHSRTRDHQHREDGDGGRQGDQRDSTSLDSGHGEPGEGRRDVDGASSEEGDLVDRQGGPRSSQEEVLVGRQGDPRPSEEGDLVDRQGGPRSSQEAADKLIRRHEPLTRWVRGEAWGSDRGRLGRAG